MSSDLFIWSNQKQKYNLEWTYRYYDIIYNIIIVDSNFHLTQHCFLVWVHQSLAC